MREDSNFFSWVCLLLWEIRFWFPTYGSVCNLSLQRGYLDKASTLLSGACVRLHNHSGTVFPTMQQITPEVCRICWRRCWGGCSVVVKNCQLYRSSCKQPMTVTTVRGVLQVAQCFSSIELLSCCNQLPSTSTRHVLVSILFQIVASSQTSTSLFHPVWEE